MSNSNKVNVSNNVIAILFFLNQFSNTISKSIYGLHTKLLLFPIALDYLLNTHVFYKTDAAITSQSLTFHIQPF